MSVNGTYGDSVPTLQKHSQWASYWYSYEIMEIAQTISSIGGYAFQYATSGKINVIYTD